MAFYSAAMELSTYQSKGGKSVSVSNVPVGQPGLRSEALPASHQQGKANIPSLGLVLPALHRDYGPLVSTPDYPYLVPPMPIVRSPAVVPPADLHTVRLLSIAQHWKKVVDFYHTRFMQPAATSHTPLHRSNQVTHLHSHMTSDSDKINVKPLTSKKYKCEDCGKSFSRSNTLVTHKRIHTGEKPFSCDTCGRAFRQPGNLTRHKLTHTAIKPYSCSNCGKAFNRASNLHTHMKIHTTGYCKDTCHMCHKKTSDKSDVKLHRPMCSCHTTTWPYGPISHPLL